MDANDAFVSSYIVQGAIVLISYAAYWPSRDFRAGLRDPFVFYIWCISASSSAVGFCAFSGFLLTVTDISNATYQFTALPYSLFLFSAALYMPLATGGYKIPTLFFLFVAALATCVLVYSSVVLFGWSWVTVLMCVLAFHCTVIDLIFWGFTWSTTLEIYMDKSVSVGCCFL